MAASTPEDLSSSPALPTQSASPEENDKQPSSQEEEDEYLFSCRCDSAKAVSSLLSCLTSSSTDHKRSTSNKNNSNTNIQPVTVFCTEDALTFHVYGSTAKQSQASVDMNKALFCDYTCRRGEFSVNLTSVLECMHVLGTHNLEHTKLCWAYSPSTQMFEMELLEQGGVLSTAAIPGLLPPTAPTKSLALAFSQSPIVSRILLASEWLKQAWSELEHVPGATVCTVAVSNKALQLATVGHAGECIVSLPSTTSNQGSVLMSLECSDSNTKNVPRSYPFSSFKLGMRGLDISQETCLTMNEAGMMAIQHQVLSAGSESGEANFVDFLMACLENEDEEEEGEGEQTVPPPLSLGWKSQEEREEDSDDEDDDEHQLPPPISAAPLFGSVVAEDNASVMSTNTTTTTRNVRRRRRSSAPQRSVQQQDHDSSSSEEEEPLDVTASMTPNRRRRRRRGRDLREEGASSPEIGYGEDD